MALSRRRMLQITAGSGLVAAVPLVRHVAWNMQDFTREGFSADPLTAPPGEDVWSNWSGIQTATPRLIAAPGAEDELATIMATGPGPIRPVGSGHSFTGLVPSEGVIVDVSRFSGLVDYDLEAKTATLGAGTRLRHAARLLSEVGLGFPNLPDIDVQTLAGSFSTATHGTGQALAAIHDYVIGLRLVTPAGDVMDVTRASNPEMFGAAKVSLGALGVITQYTLQLRDSYALHRHVWIEELDTLMARADDLFAQHRNFEFYYSPPTGYAIALAHDIHEGPITGRTPSGDDDSLAALKEARDMFGWSSWLRAEIVRGSIDTGTVEDSTDEYWKLLATARPHKFNEMEYHIPAENGLAAAREIFAQMDGRKDAFFPIEVRKTAPDDAWLSPFNDGERISIAIHAAHDEAYDYFFDVFEPIFLKHGGRPHWGKLHSLGARELSGLYDRFDDFRALRRQLDPDGKFLNPHLAHLFGEAVGV